MSWLPFAWYNLLFFFITDTLDSWLGMGTSRVVVISLVAQWVDVGSVGTKIVTTVAVSLERISSLFSMFSCSKIEFIAGMKWSFRISLTWRVISSGVDHEPVFD